MKITDRYNGTLLIIVFVLFVLFMGYLNGKLVQ
jgi:hypothetical protein